jgi:hypothetical protein
MSGTYSAENNIREGGAILEVAMDDDDDDNFSKDCCIGGNIIGTNVTEGLMSLPPVESRVMACHTMRGTRSAGNNNMEGGAILEVAMDAVLGATSLRVTLLKDFHLPLVEGQGGVGLTVGVMWG